MAILSNINDKFAVDSSGGIQFSGQTGTSGYVLKSNGNAAPTWVDGSTVIGGPYLPLSGGTLTGATATASGISFTVGGILTAQSSSSGDYVRLYGSSGTGKWDIYGNGANLRISDNESAGILAVDTGATFGGNITASGTSSLFNTGGSGTFITNDASGYPRITITSASAQLGLFRKSDGGMYIGGSSGGFRIYNSSFSQKLLIDSGTGAATFAGKIASVKELVNINSSNDVRSAGLESDTTGNIWLGTGTTAATINFVTGNSTNGLPSTNGVKRLTTNREGTDIYASFASNTFPFRVGYLNGSTYTPTFVVNDNKNVGIDAIPETGMVTYVKQLRIGEQSAFQGHADGVGQDSATWLTTNYKFTSSGTVFINGTAAAPGFSTFYQQQVGDHSFGCSPLSGVAGAATGSRIQLVIKQSGNVGIANTAPSTFLTLGTYNTSGKYRNQAPFPDLPAEHMVHIAAPSLNGYFGGGISWGETAFTAASIGVQDAGGNGALNMVFGTRNTTGQNREVMRITSGGILSIGDINPTLAERLVIAASSGSGNVVDISTGTTANSNVGAIVFRNSARAYCGQITVNGATAVTSYLSASDYRLKEDLQDFQGLSLVSNIKVYDYKWKSVDERTYGVMAHELQEILPQAVNGEKDAEEMQSVDYSKIVPLLVKSIQELKAEIDILKNK